MSWGGRRVGAGRRSEKPVVLRAHPGGQASAEVSRMPPEDWPAEQKAVWQEWVGLALEKRTLTTHTMPAFRLLCELQARKVAMGATIDRDGLTYLKCWVDSSGQEHTELKKHPLIGEFRQLSQRVQTLLGQFGLAPFGKPVEGQRKPAVNPFAAIGAK